jgi:hypothetical protein
MQNTAAKDNTLGFLSQRQGAGVPAARFSFPNPAYCRRKRFLARLSPYDRYQHSIMIFFHYITLSEEK